MAKKKQSSIYEIVSDGHPALREVAAEVPLSDIASPKIQDLIAEMKVVLASQNDGIGLAAPQIGVSKRIFIVSKKVFGENAQDAVYINPVITKESKEKRWMEGEGCLSVRWIYGKVQRSTKVSLKAYDEKGILTERGAGGLLAHIFQHEVDHLNGILFIDRAKDLEHVDPQDVNPVTHDHSGHEHEEDDIEISEVTGKIAPLAAAGKAKKAKPAASAKPAKAASAKKADEKSTGSKTARKAPKN